MCGYQCHKAETKNDKASNLAGRIALQFYQRFLVLQLGGLIFVKHVICIKSKLLHVKSRA